MKKLTLLILFLNLFLAGHVAQAQNNSSLNRVYLEGPLSPIALESKFSISVLLDGVDPINAFDLEIVYEKDKLKFSNSDNTGSIVDIWQPAPRILPNGNIRLGGGILKAFNGKKGLFVKLSFKAIGLGRPKFFFAKSNLYIADGKGTEVQPLTGDFSVSLKEDGKLISEPTVPFEETEADVLIKKDLESFKSQMFLKKIFILLPYFILLIFGICVWAVYNKHRRKT